MIRSIVISENKKVEVELPDGEKREMTLRRGTLGTLETVSDVISIPSKQCPEGWPDSLCPTMMFMWEEVFLSAYDIKHTVY